MRKAEIEELLEEAGGLEWVDKKWRTTEVAKKGLE
jgi:hypothetical protein